ncbi:putative nucleoside-diphosphate sugar epimerase [Bernardetia litoralis DSM 6794]|uniref:Putative nucleoside-diphosphate sugar epimerase n=1 Tax=Bernardetia litoralis (strain ATCC 23117 / DSM 6794 / NBRC 15988 / NCIMB 1366 / Fx l1 / Sio-4) TaxID=880071 RepID=I4ANB5_BERLS|nr:SDR family oxidoreductase [Bernardetia litoralis]AFM05450.1 putative nucleoside-diphosphate sugar epimerase [Bernardetia litoralis DSM 6794]
MKIAVTSASGKLGSSIVKHLIKEVGKDNVVGIARTLEKATHLGIEIRKGDYNNQKDFDVALKNVDTVLLVSGMDEPQKRIQQHRNVIEAAKNNNIKKIVYTSIVGAEENNAFSPIVKANRQTEKDIQTSGLEWVIGRNGIYIEPDLEYLETYVQEGEIRNCAGTGKCTYTSREELGYAYAKMLIEDKHNRQIYNLVGTPITQNQLVEYINQVYNTNLIFNSVLVEEYATERKAALGDFMGTIIAGIYEGIRDGVNNVPSDFEKAAGRKHQSTLDMIKGFKIKR